MKINRHAVFEKCHGHCAYCGVVLDRSKFQVDHVESKFLHEYYKSPNDPDREENLMPSCARCNLRKRDFTVEQFRHEIAQQVTRLTRDSAAFRLAKDFGLIQESGISVVFYFEQLGVKE